MKTISLAHSRAIYTCQRRLLLTLCCLLSMLPTLCAHAQAPEARLLWEHAIFTGVLAYSPTQSLIAAAQGFGEIALLQPDGTLVRTIHNGQSTIFSLAFAPDGQTLASGNNNDTFKLWRMRDGVCLRTITVHAEVKDTAIFSPDSQTSWANGISLPGSYQYAALTVGDRRNIFVAFAPDGQTLASGNWDGTIKLWRVSDGTCLQTITAVTNSGAGRNGILPQGGPTITFVAFTPDGQTLASSSGDKTIKLWRVRDGICLRTLTGAWGDMAFAPDGQTLASSNGKLWRVRDGVCLQSIPGACGLIAFAPDRQTLATGGGNGAIKLWRVRDGACLQSLTGHTDFVSSVAFAPDGQTLASGFYNGIKYLARARRRLHQDPLQWGQVAHSLCTGWADAGLRVRG